MPRRVELVIRALQLGKAESLRIALVGMGGVGKTTLVKAVLIQIRQQFDFICFVEDVQDEMKRHTLHELVRDNLYVSRGGKVHLLDGDAQSLWLHLQGEKVLIILDDVESEDQISEMLSPEWLGTGSRLLITSRIRSPGLLPTFAMHMVELKFLSEEESEELFLAYLDADVLRVIPKDLIKKVELKCDALPLTLEMIGSYLRFEKNVDVWTSALENLTKAESLYGSVGDRLWAKRRISFDDLAPLFLDVAVFDKCDAYTEQYDANLWRIVWLVLYGTSVYSGVRNLVDRSFIVLDWPLTKKIKIHEQLRDMGKSVSRPSDMKIELCRGVWESNDIAYLLNKYKGDKAQTEVLSSSMGPDTTPTEFQSRYPWSSISKLPKVRLLRLSNVTMTGHDGHRFPCKLVFIHLTSCGRGSRRRFQYLRGDCWPIREEDVEGLHRLTVLRLDNCTSVHLPSNFHKLSNLKVLIIRGGHLKILPEKFGLLPALEELFLEDVGLSQLPYSFYQLSSLQTLTLKGCSALTTAFVPKLAGRGGKAPRPLTALTDLRLENIEGLTELPESLGMLESLGGLTIRRCSDLKKLPEGLGKLQNLLVLNIDRCDKLESLCESIGELQTLSWLLLNSCPHLQRLPDSVGHLRLVELYLFNMNFVSLPESIGELEFLRILCIGGLEHLRCVPETLGQLKSLERVWFISCFDLESLPESVGQLDALRKFTLTDAFSLERLPDSIGQLTNLSTLRIEGCISLESLPNSLGQVRNLEKIIIKRCSSLDSLPQSMGQLSSLEWFELGDCENVRFLPESLGQLKVLNNINLSGCKNLKRLPESFGQVQALTELDLSGCENLENTSENTRILRTACSTKFTEFAGEISGTELAD